MKISDKALVEVEEALKEYEQEVERSNLAPDSKRTYRRHASTFARWLGGRFTPGSMT